MGLRAPWGQGVAWSSNEGLHCLQFGYEGRVPLKGARLFYEVSEKARQIVESYFMLNSTLYFSYTHLVCRTALAGEAVGPCAGGAWPLATVCSHSPAQGAGALPPLVPAEEGGCCPRKPLSSQGVG